MDRGNQKDHYLLKGYFNDYTPLNKSMKKIKDDVKVVELMKLLPQKNQKLLPLRANKYHKFHKHQSHNRNECVSLKNKIEELIKRGYLLQYKKYDHGESKQPYKAYINCKQQEWTQSQSSKE